MTSIRDLQMKENLDVMNSQRNEQISNSYMPPRVQQYQGQQGQGQQVNQVNQVQNNIQQEQLERIVLENKKNKETIDQLAKEINGKLNKKDDLEDEDKEEEKEEELKKNNILDKMHIPGYLHEAIVIFVLYVLLSLPPVRNILSKYVSQLSNKNVEIVVYGFLLAVLFMICKKWLI
jgi:hypothetical protein